MPSPGYVRQFLARAHDAFAIESVQLEEVRDQLDAAWEATAIFNLTQILLSPREPASVQALAADELDESLKNGFATELSERRLFSAQIPDECRKPEGCSPEVATFLERLFSVQVAIKDVSMAFDGVEDSSFEDGEDNVRKQFLATSIREGLFRSMVLVAASINQKAQVHFRLDRSPSLKSIRGHRVIVSEWLTGLKVTEESTDAEWVNQLDLDATGTKRARGQRHERLDRAKELEQILAKVDEIENLLRNGKEGWAIENAEALVKEQVKKSGKTFACQSLCNLAARAQSLGLFKVQLRWAKSAVELNSEDPVAKNQLAHALFRNGMVGQARAIYDQVIAQHPDNLFAKTGRAETLRSHGNYDEALKAYEQVIEQHPDDVVAKNSRAETLRSQGNYDEALKAYEQVIEQHPDDVFAKTGRSETLRSQGNYDEALKAYEQVIAQHPDNVVAKSGRAETLRSQGNSDEALKAYEQVIAQHPEDVVAKNSRAETLKSQGKYDEALKAYEQVIAQHPDDVVAKSGRAETLRSLGNYDAALKAYEQVIEQHPDSVVAKSGRAETLRSQGNYDEALKAYEQVIAQHPDNVVAKNSRAETLKSQGKYDEALKAYEQVIGEHPYDTYAKIGKISTLLSARRVSDAIESLSALDVDRTSPRSTTDWVAFHIQAMIYLMTGKLQLAERDFSYGVKECQIAENHNYFVTALAVVQMKRSRWREAQRTVESSTPNTVLLHLVRSLVLFENNEAEAASGAIADLPVNPTSKIGQMHDQMKAKYVEKVPHPKSTDWFLDEATDLLMMAA